MAGSCSISNCDNPPRGRYCDMHWKRLQRGAPMNAVAMVRQAQERLSAYDRVVQAARNLENCDSEDDVEFRKLEDCFKKALERFRVEAGARRAGKARMEQLSLVERRRLSKKANDARWGRERQRVAP